MNASLFEDLLTIIKKKSTIRNTEQAVELISLFIFLLYIKLYMKQKNELDLRINNICNENTSEIKEYYQKLYQRFICLKNITNKNNDMHEQIMFKIGSIIDNAKNSEIITYIEHSLQEIRTLQEFYRYANSYQSLLLRMVNESGRSGEYFTPSALVKIMVDMLSPTDEKSIYDPACGTSGLLIESAKYIKANSKRKKTSYSLVGIDTSSFACIISIVNLLINKEMNFEIVLKDSLNYKKNYVKYDFVLANPPFGKKLQRSAFHMEKIYKGSNIDYYFLEHAIDSLSINGKAAIILPERFLYDLSEECIALKNKIFINFHLECILCVPSGALLPYTAVKLCILLINNSGPTNEVYFYNLRNGEKYSRTNTIKSDDFINFLDSLKTRKKTECSWIINVSKNNMPYNLLLKDKEREPCNFLSNSIINIEQTISNNESLLKELTFLKEKIAYLEKKINEHPYEDNLHRVKVGSIAIIRSGKLLQKSKLLSEGPFPVYGGNGIIGYNDKAMEYGDSIIVGKVGALCGNVRYVQGNIWVTNNSLIIKNNSPDKIITSYLAKILSALNLRNLAVGTAQQYITTTQIKDIEVSLPTLTAQQTLSVWLDELDNTLEKHDNLIEKIKKCKHELKENLHKGLLIK